VSTPGTTDPDHELAIERGRNIVAPLVRRGSGVAVAVGVDGRLVWSEGFGRTAVAGGEPVTPDTPFRVYSLMKQVTAVLTLQSAGRGELALGESVRRVMPDLPDHYEPVTPLHLLTHTAGVRHYRDAAEAASTDHCVSAAQALSRFIDDPLVGVPGGAESYSTWGFALLSALLERGADVPFDSLLALRVMAPAGMSATRLEGAPGAGTRLLFYDVDAGGHTRETPPVDNSCKMGGGGFLASAEDLVRFHNTVLRGDLVPLAAVRRMLGERTALVAGGSGPGAHAVSSVDMQSGVSVVILSNTSGLEQEIALERARELLAAVFTP
jgi:CubicO group peptidase (beta-lactamase class C family)